jgi:hypothetical protein
MNNLNTVFVKIDAEVKNRSLQYVVSSKMKSIEKTDSLKNLVEVALDYYMSNNPIQE